MSIFRVVIAALLTVASAAANSETLGAYVGAGVGIPHVAYGSSGLAFKLFGGYKVHQFDISKAGKLDLAVQGEYINFGNSSVNNTSWKQSGVAVAAVGSWVIPKKMAPWANEKVAVLAKVGGSRVAYSSNPGSSYTATGVTHGIGADYSFTPQFSARAMVEYYPGSYNVYGISGVFKF
ncbi:MAG: porin family protein [Gammaproteobacteria bacterium]|nr:porin family protein [Gammaproteobacteria bacterium]MBU1482825.1 porin family protein [Gammaproteobacteria bacterium]